MSSLALPLRTARRAAWTLLPCAVVAAQGPSWTRHALPYTWPAHTVVLGAGDHAWLLHDDDLSRLMADGTLNTWYDVLPCKVGPFSACLREPSGRILVVPGDERPAFRLDPVARTATALPGITPFTQRGAMLTRSASGAIYLGLGGRTLGWGRIDGGTYQPLPTMDTVNPMGGYSSGLFAHRDLVLAFGDHHVNTFQTSTNTWRPKSDLWVQLGFRPRHDRGGMTCQDPVSDDVYMTLGHGSHSIGVMDTVGRHFFHLRPRLPLRLVSEDRGLFLLSIGKEVQVCALSRADRAWWSIPRDDLVRIGPNDKRADVGSVIDVWNTSRFGSHGDLARQRDSVTNAVYVGGYLYVQRKNIVRRIEYRTLLHSPSGAGYLYGARFAQKGAAFATDGKVAWLLNGFDDILYRLDLGKGPEPADIPDIQVERRAILPAYFNTDPNRDLRGINTALAILRGQVYAVPDAITQVMYRYDPERNEWNLETVLPGALGYTDDHGIDMLPLEDRLIVLARDHWAAYVPGGGWTEPVKLGFEYSADGGMAALDPWTGIVYVVIGGGSRDLGLLRAYDGASHLLRDYLPDTVSVHGRRAFVIQDAGLRYLYMLRGHDSAEHWRIPLQGPGAPAFP